MNSAIEAWENNGRKNGWKGPDAESLDGMRNIIEYGVGTDGAFKIPVCGWKEMWKSFSEGAPGPDKNPYWPCENVS